MRKCLLGVTVGLLVASGAWAGGSTHVQGYYRQDGTYVAPHYRTTPDASRSNNWSSQGMVNPHTGQRGTVNPYTPQTPQNPYRR